LVVGSVGLLQAQDTGFSKDFKLRLGYTPSPKDNLRTSYQNFGFNLAYGLGAGKIGLELGYFYQSGDPFVTAPVDGTAGSGKLAMDPAKAIDDKKNSRSGITLRASWQSAITPTWDWQAGLQFGTKFKGQYNGEADSVAATAGTTKWIDLYSGVPEEGGLNTSPFAGVTWKIDADSALEINLALQSYSALNYTHVAGTASHYDLVGTTNLSSSDATWPQDRLKKTTSSSLYLEIAYVFHF
jgi:hypothetical protein